MNLVQNMVDAIMGDGAFQVADLDINIQALLVVFLALFAYLALRSMARFFLSLGSKF